MTLKIPGAAQFDTARVAVVGLGLSGRASVEALREHTNADISVWDTRESALEPYRGDARINQAGVDSDAAQLARHVLSWQPSHIVIAPSFPEKGEAWAVLHAGPAPVLSEIELAWQLRAQLPDGSYAPWLAITGTNGKTTTTTMLAAILRDAGLAGLAVGNVGNPVVTAVTNTDDDAPRAFACELSSFQLMSTVNMQAEAAVCLNIADDHLEWHQGFESYRRAKASIYDGVKTACIYPVGDADVQAMVDNADVQEGARAVGVVLGVPSIGQIGVVEDVAVDRAFGAQRATHAVELFEIRDIAHLAPYGSDLPAHIVKDALAAAALARAIGVEPRHIKSALAAFPAGRHRIEHVASINGVHFVDDSKATNAHAALASLRAMPDHSVVWIVGGQAKGSRFNDLVTRVASKIRAAVVIGVDQEPWRCAFADVQFPVEYVDPKADNPMGAAVALSLTLAHEADTVLLAPASASMDQFVSYADRGDAFTREVRAVGAAAHIGGAQ